MTNRATPSQTEQRVGCSHCDNCVINTMTEKDQGDGGWERFGEGVGGQRTMLLVREKFLKGH